MAKKPAHGSAAPLGERQCTAISATRFCRSGAVGDRLAPVDADLLKLELTESVLLENIEEATQTMDTLRQSGVRFALDDFGTGYSSLRYLKKLPIDQLKIDQSFVRDITLNQQDRAIVRTIIAMASNLSVDCIAEGVETEEEYQLLRGDGCQLFQGHLFGCAQPLSLFEAALQAQTS
ncbi:MAG: EAL domain-containing protein [Betaproteobacteria bacterium]|nr:EAL domain-containing protein [Betaproteobacteria bacterium]